MPATDAFQDARNMLLLARVLSRLEERRESDSDLDKLLCDVERENGYRARVPLVNQAIFLAMLYSTALWLKETYFYGNAGNLLRKHVSPFLETRAVKITYGEGAAAITCATAERLARRLRNAVAHARVEIHDDRFVFKDENSSKTTDWVVIEMPWATVGEYTMALIGAGNELLYGEQGDPAGGQTAVADL